MFDIKPDERTMNTVHHLEDMIFYACGENDKATRAFNRNKTASRKGNWSVDARLEMWISFIGEHKLQTSLFNVLNCSDHYSARECLTKPLFRNNLIYEEKVPERKVRVHLHPETPAQRAEMLFEQIPKNVEHGIITKEEARKAAVYYARQCCFGWTPKNRTTFEGMVYNKDN